MSITGLCTTPVDVSTGHESQIATRMRSGAILQSRKWHRYDAPDPATKELRTKMRVFITGTAGFIGFHLAKRLMSEGHELHGYDGMTDYYDLRLKQDRHAELTQHNAFSKTIALLEDQEALDRAVDQFVPDVIVHLAGQAGVRYSLENPRAYLDANIIGSFNVMEAARRLNVDHLLMASTSSAYGANRKMPFAEIDKADTQMTIYAATKKASENMAHVYAHLHSLPVTMFRFFTVYGAWSRPDMVPFKFADLMRAGRPIDIYNNGEMYRDFTFIDDLVEGITRLIDVIPLAPGERSGEPVPGDSLSDVAPFRVVNIGNGEKVRLMDFVSALEEELGVTAEKNFLPMQPGDVPATWASAALLEALTGEMPKTHYRDGIAAFAKWYRDYFDKRDA